MQNRNFPLALTQRDLYPGRTVMWRRRDDEFRITILEWPRLETLQAKLPGTGREMNAPVQVWVVKVRLGNKDENHLVSSLGARPLYDDTWDEYNRLMPIA